MSKYYYSYTKLFTTTIKKFPNVNTTFVLTTAAAAATATAGSDVVVMDSSLFMEPSSRWIGATTTTRGTNDTFYDRTSLLLLQQLVSFPRFFSQTTKTNCSLCEATTTTTTTTRSIHKNTDKESVQTDELKLLQRRMTSIGHFSMISETSINPSIITFFMVLRGSEPLYRTELIDLWKEKQLHHKHPRFHYVVDPDQQKQFTTNTTTTTTNGNTTSGDKNNTNKDVTVSSSESDIESHISESLFPWGGKHEIISRIKAMQMERWSLHDTLWHMNVVPWGPLDVLTGSTGATNNKTATPPMNDDNDNENTVPTVQLNDYSHYRKSQIEKCDGQSLILFRGHHILGDGASIGATLMELFDESELLLQQIHDTITKLRSQYKEKLKSYNIFQRIFFVMNKLFQFFVGSLYAVYYQMYLHVMSTFLDTNPWRIVHKIQIRNARKVDKNGNKLDDSYNPTDRSISYSDVAPIEQIKWVANILGGPNCTVNDVFVTCVAVAVTKQLQSHRQKIMDQWNREQQENKDEHKLLFHSTTATPSSIPELKYMNIAMPVHLKGGVVLPGESLGNNLGAIVARVPGTMDLKDDDNDNNIDIDPETKKSIQRLQGIHEVLYQLKRTPTAYLSHVSAKTLSYVATILPVSWVAKLYELSNANSIAVISNNRGSPIPLHLHGRVVESFYGFVPLPPGIPIGVVLMSYNGSLNCTVTAQTWAVPDADQFLIWILEEYIHLARIAITKDSEKKDNRLRKRKKK